ncbi:MAG: nuclear transport factor 2 family protein [Gammaproteobacteria bacterium]|nr:nuclear transport factor 2 family protein [Gammaproteobacteria bacterium]NNC98154.1 nuclear transport factor 2 family protein [Gammaproteobacteria bacterium]NNM13685.1 nuclear transport factor 2 family protein [Gammaproteobacteria bacterium]
MSDQGYQTSEISGDYKVTNVKNFIDAFNQRDLEKMLSLVSHDMQWFFINGDKLIHETANRSELSLAMEKYFSDCETCQSRLVKLISSNARVSAIEEASWDSDKERKSQRSLSVYEFEGELIKRVYYFPEE